MRRPPVIALLCFALVACGEDVSGNWCGKRVAEDEACQGDDVGFLLLQQRDDIVDGQACEAFDHDCHLVERGKIDGASVRFEYSFQGGNYVRAELIVRGSVMTGRMYSSKCDCFLPFSFYRVD